MEEKGKIISKIREKIRTIDSMELDSCIQKIDFTEDLLRALLFSCGYNYVDMKFENHIISFWAGVVKNEYDIKLKIKYDKIDKKISGYLSDTLKKAYSIIYALENSLDSTIMLPPEIKFKNIDRLCKKLDVDKEFYSTILKNWSFG